jgi:hypothetical protein
MASTLRFDNWEDSDGNPVASAATGVGTILQVVSTTKTDTFSMSGTDFTTVPTFSASITPVSTSSKVFVLANFTLGNTATDRSSHARLMRGSTSIYEGDTSGSRVRSSAGEDLQSAANVMNATPVFLDSPASSAEVTYSLQIAVGTGGFAVFGRSGTNTDSGAGLAVPASITLMEVAG